MDELSNQASLEDVLDEQKLDEGQRDALREAEEVEEKGLDLVKVHEQANEKQNTAEHHMRDASTKKKNVVEKFEDRKDWHESDQFQEFEDDGFIDIEYYWDVWEIAEVSLEMFDDLAVGWLILDSLGEELLDNIKEQQIIHDEKRVVNQIQNITQIYEKNMQNITEPLRKTAERLEEMGDIVREKEILEHEVSELEETVEQLQDDVSVDTAAARYNLKEEKKRVLALLRADLGTGDISEVIGISDDTVRNYREEFENKNLI